MKERGGGIMAHMGHISQEMAHVGHDRGAVSRQGGRVVQVHIWMDTTQPPAGRLITAEGEPARPFVGWLQLLAVLAEAFERQAGAPFTPLSEAGR